MPEIEVLQKIKNTHIEESRSNLNISYSQLSTYYTCPKQWHLKYVKKMFDYTPSIHSLFGTALHETVQQWLDVLYNQGLRASEELDTTSLLKDKMSNIYLQEKSKNKGESFTTSVEMTEFYNDGLEILDYLKKKRAQYFSTRKVHLAGIETHLYFEISPGVFFKGFIDLVLYDESIDQWTIIDIKSSTSGWGSYAKDDEVKISQILLYKEFFARQFDVDVKQIEILYLILKRKVNEESEYSSGKSRIQQFVPPSGPAKRKKALNLLGDFLKTTLDENSKFIDREYEATPSKSSCKFCPFKDTVSCSLGV